MPAGPGARELTEFFAHVDAKLALADAAAPKTQRSDREVLNLLTKRAQSLHLGAANYCWFTDPSRALCLKLAGTPHADRPLAGMCDSARCPQATHHPCHRPVWAEHAEQDQDLPRQPRPHPQDRAGPSASRPRPGPARPGRHRRRHTRTIRSDMRITADQRAANENRIRAAIDRLLRGEIPPGGRCDVKTLAGEAGVDRTAFYGNRPYAHLRIEFEERLQARQAAGNRPDPRDAQIGRLKNEVTALKQRLIQSASTIGELTGFRTQALAQLAAQHDEITGLRASATAASGITRLPQRTTTIGSCS